MSIPFQTVERAGQIVKLLRLTRDPKTMLSPQGMHKEAQHLTDAEKKEAGVWAKAFEIAANPQTSVSNGALALHDMITRN